MGRKNTQLFMEFLCDLHPYVKQHKMSLISEFNCDQNDQLDFEEGKALCSKCNKHVFDLMQLSEKEVHDFLEFNPKACTKVPQAYINKGFPRKVVFLSSLLLVFGSALFSNVSFGQETHEIPYEYEVASPIIKGVITDEFGEELLFVNITIQAANYSIIGTCSGFYGEYSLEVPPEVASIGDKIVLKIEYLGYPTKEIELELRHRMVLNVEMKTEEHYFLGVIISQPMIDPVDPFVTKISGDQLDHMIRGF